ncbi:MAG: Ca-activated chloride channel family protein [Gammaproteobacteria bacterium]|jgi:Ca-activated chloride channel family protein
MGNSFTEFHFLRPGWFALLIPMVFLIWRLVRRRDAAGIWQSICDDALLPFLLVQRSANRNSFNEVLVSIVGLLAITALAGPAWERLPTPVFRDQSALVLLLDLSRSMDATDVSPSRLERAKFKITDILRQRQEGQTALIVYAAEPYVVTPLTNDVATIESQLPALRTNIMPSQGSATSLAIEKGIDLLTQGGVPSGDILLISDGLPLGEVIPATKLIESADIRFSILGVGTPEGAPIPDSNGGFVKDKAGNIVVEPLKPQTMRELVEHGSGLYQTIRVDDNDISMILDSIDDGLNNRNNAATDRFANRWREFGPWLLALLVPFAPLAFRRGILSIGLGLGILAGSYTPVATAGWWATPDQEASEKFQQNDFTGAAETFEDPVWGAAANYRAGRYAAAAEQLADAPDPEALYNLGNSFARLGRYEEALTAYDKTLAALANHEDAKHNKKLIEDLIKEQQEQEQENQPDGSDDEQSGDQDAAANGEQQNAESDGSPSDNNSQNSAESSETPEEPSESSSSAEQETDGQKQLDEPDAPTDEPQAEAEAQEQERAEAQANSEMENDQATEQWLRQIPDDPGGLLRRKFEYEFQKKYGARARRPQAW